MGTKIIERYDSNILLEELQRYKESHNHLEILNDFSRKIFLQNTVEDVCWSIAKNAVAALGFEDCVVYLIDEHNHYLVQTAAHGPKNPTEKVIFNPINIAIGAGIVGAVAESGEASIIADTTTDSRYIEDDRARASEITVPMVVKGKVVGVIDSENSQKNFFTEEHLSILKSIAYIAAIKIDEYKTRDKLDKYRLNLESIVSERTDEISKSLKALKLSNENLRQFGYFVSHDLREPLRNITTYLNLIKRYLGEKQTDEIDEMMNFTLEGAKRMDMLINNIQAFTMLGKESQNIDQIFMPDLIMSVKQNLSVLILEQNAKVIYSGLNEIKTDKGLLSLVLQNLIQNAIKYRHTDRSPDIRVSSELAETSIQISVSDNGIGINEENQEMIFNLFSRVKTSSIRGSGIGLATCKRIIDHLGGVIVVSSVPGEGSVFSFSIPFDTKGD